MNSKTKWSITFTSASLALAFSAMPLAAQAIQIPVMQFGFMEADAARDLFNSGQDLFLNAKYAQAEDVFRQVLKKYPRNEIADRSSYYLAYSLAKQGKITEAKTQIDTFKKQYPRSSWLNDVEELRVKITNDIPAEYLAMLRTPQAPTPPPTPPRATPAATARSEQSSTARGTSYARADSRSEVSPEVSLQREVLRVLFENDPDHAIEIATDRLKADPTDPVALGNLHMVANSRSDKALPMLVTLAKTSPDSRTRRDAVTWISQSRADKDTIADILIGLVPSMIADDDSSGITYALSRVNTPKTIDALASIARDKSKSDRVRMNALNWITESRVPNRLSLLDDIYKSNMDNPKIRRQIIPYIGRSKDPQAVSILSNIASTDPDLSVKRDAVVFLGQIKTPEALKALEELLTRKP
jgi:tetratricopeptide (TPR) repeat protein